MFRYYFTPSQTHVCSDNYKYNTISYCICKLDGTHSKHIHNYSGIESSVPNYHILGCICSCKISDYHTHLAGSEMIDSKGEKYTFCQLCDYKFY